MSDNGRGYGLLGRGLAQYLTMPEVNSIWYNGQQIYLDGFKFVRCRFDNCLLVVTSLNFEIESCFIDESTRIQFLGETIKPIKLFNSRYEWVYEKMPYFAPLRNSDGTITVKA